MEKSCEPIHGKKTISELCWLENGRWFHFSSRSSRLQSQRTRHVISLSLSMCLIWPSMVDLYPYLESKTLVGLFVKICLKLWSSFQLYLQGFEDIDLVNQYITELPKEQKLFLHIVYVFVCFCRSRSRWGCHITDNGLYQIASTRCVSNLTSISLWGMTAITDSGVVQLVIIYLIMPSNWNLEYSFFYHLKKKESFISWFDRYQKLLPCNIWTLEEHSSPTSPFSPLQNAAITSR